MTRYFEGETKASDLPRTPDPTTTRTRVVYPCLIVVASPEPDHQGLHFILRAHELVIGRSDQCAIRLNDPTVSRRHALITVVNRPGELTIQVSHLTAAAGATRIGTELLSADLPRLLRPGDRLQLGDTVLSYILFEHEPQLAQHIDNIKGLIQKAEYERALQTLTVLKQHRLIGGDGNTTLEKLLMSARYYEARLLSIQGKWNRAIELLQELLAHGTLDPSLRVKAGFHLGVLYLHLNELTQAQAQVDQARQIAEGLSPYFRALVLCLQAMTERRRRDFPGAQKTLSAAIPTLSPRENLASRLVLEQATVTLDSQQHDLARDQLNRLFAGVPLTATQKIIAAECLLSLGTLQSRRRDFAAADNSLQQALKSFKEKQWKFLEYKAQQSLALNYQGWGRLDDALVHLKLCHEFLATDVENPYEQAVVASQLGEVYLSRGDAQEALRWFERARSLQTGRAWAGELQASICRHIARTYRSLGRALPATQAYQRAVEEFAKLSDFAEQGLTLEELCKHRIDMRDVTTAAVELEQAEACFKQAGRVLEFLPRVAALRAHLAWASGDRVKAREFFSFSLHSLEASAPSPSLAETYLAFGRLCAELSDEHKRQATGTAEASEHSEELRNVFETGLQCATLLNLGALVAQFREELKRLDPPRLALPAPSPRADEPLRILHLSDLHLGADADVKTLLQPLIADLRDPGEGLGIRTLDHVVISGDLTQRASPEEFERAARFVSGLLEEFKLSPEKCVIVPGNHDLSWDEDGYDFKKKRQVGREQLKEGHYIERGDWLRMRNEALYPLRFRAFSQHFYYPLMQREYPLEFQEQGFVSTFPDSGLQFLAFNSAWESDEHFPRRAGVHEGALSRALALADEELRLAVAQGKLSAGQSLLRIAVRHHPATSSTADLTGSSVSDEAFLERLRRGDIRLCLHGHVHEDRAELVYHLHPTRRIHVIGAGSFDAPAAHRPESTPRLYNLMQIARTHDAVRVYTRCRRKQGGAWEGWAQWPAASPSERCTYYDIAPAPSR